MLARVRGRTRKPQLPLVAPGKGPRKTARPPHRIFCCLPRGWPNKRSGHRLGTDVENRPFVVVEFAKGFSRGGEVPTTPPRGGRTMMLTGDCLFGFTRRFRGQGTKKREKGLGAGTVRRFRPCPSLLTAPVKEGLEWPRFQYGGGGK